CPGPPTPPPTPPPAPRPVSAWAAMVGEQTRKGPAALAAGPFRGDGGGQPGVRASVDFLVQSATAWASAADRLAEARAAALDVRSLLSLARAAALEASPMASLAFLT